MTLVINLSELGFREVQETIELLQAYMNEKNKGNDQIWLNKILYDNTIPKMVLVSDDNKQYEESKGKLKKLPKIQQLSYMETDD